MKSKRIFETANLIIRPSIFDDCKFFAEWETRPDVIEFFSVDDDQSYEDVVRDFIRAEESPTEGIYTIVLKSTDSPIGKMYVSRYNEKTDSIDITKLYIADEANRNKGYGKEAVYEFLEYAFIDMHLERVTIDYFTGNDAAAHLYSKIGFKPEGVARNSTKKNGQYFDLNVMSMLRAEFFSSRDY